MLTRSRALGCVLLLWAAIYLPALGSLEIRGEEGRRLLPGVTMLETGHWIVPSIGGVDYLAKPPLINWLAAGAFEAAGDTRSEWAGRAPSALAVLALGLGIVAALGSWLGNGGALLTAVFALTNIGLMEKGRLAEIEALYVSLTGLAIVLWLGAWRTGSSAWRIWTLPFIFLGLGMLAKGPTHLLFFYAVVVGVLVCAGRWREIFNWPHLLGIPIMLAIFGAWAVPYLQQTGSGHGGSAWAAQFQGRIELNDSFHLRGWLLNIPRGLANYFPWIVLLPLAFLRLPTSPTDADQATTRAWLLDRAVVRGLRWATAATFLLVSLLPGGLPRYTLPLLTPASVLLTLVLRRGWGVPATLFVVWSRTAASCLAVAALAAPVAAFEGRAQWWHWLIAPAFLAIGAVAARRLFRARGPLDWTALGLASATTMALCTMDYALGAVPILEQTESVRPAAAEIDQALGGERAAMLRPGFVPFLFYLRRSPRYLQTAAEMPLDLDCLLVRAEDEPAALAAIPGRVVVSKSPLISDKRVHGNDHPGWLLLRFATPPRKGL